jgi:hypothetical protein
MAQVVNKEEFKYYFLKNKNVPNIKTVGLNMLRPFSVAIGDTKSERCLLVVRLVFDRTLE